MSKCPVETIIKLLEKKWTLLIIRELAKGKTRFCRLQQAVGNLNPRTLSSRLRELEREKIISRRAAADSIRVEYELTPKGNDLLSVLETINIWAHKWND